MGRDLRCRTQAVAMTPPKDASTASPAEGLLGMGAKGPAFHDNAFRQ
jgi:hypothetical protein